MDNSHGEGKLDVLLEKITNVENITNTGFIHKVLNEAIKINGKRERQVRESTITFNINGNGLDKDSIIEQIETKWIIENKKPAATF